MVSSVEQSQPFSCPPLLDLLVPCHDKAKHMPQVSYLKNEKNKQTIVSRIAKIPGINEPAICLLLPLNKPRYDTQMITIPLKLLLHRNDKFMTVTVVLGCVSVLINIIVE